MDNKIRNQKAEQNLSPVDNNHDFDLLSLYKFENISDNIDLIQHAHNNYANTN